MLRSLVGSEMCIRGSGKKKKKIGHVGKKAQLTIKKRARFDGQIRSLLRDQVRDPDLHPRPVAHTHLKPPTKREG